MTTRKLYRQKLKARVVEWIPGEETLSELGPHFKAHPMQIGDVEEVVDGATAQSVRRWADAQSAERRSGDRAVPFINRLIGPTKQLQN
jgi:hypothetical protein